MTVDTQPFSGVNMVEGYDRSARRQLDFALGINMAGLVSHRQTKNKEADPGDRPQKRRKRVCHRGTSKVRKESAANFF
jgi:hypothetical protein